MKNQVTTLSAEISSKIITVRDTPVLLDADVATLYGVETRRINEAVRENPDKFPEGYMFPVCGRELDSLRSEFPTANLSTKRRSNPNVFTEKGLYMLATIIKSEIATSVTIAIIETFTAVRGLKRELVELHNEQDQKVQQSKLTHFGQVLTDIVMPDLDVTETESTLELNFMIAKLKHTVKRTKTKE